MPKEQKKEQSQLATEIKMEDLDDHLGKLELPQQSFSPAVLTILEIIDGSEEIILNYNFNSALNSELNPNQWHAIVFFIKKRGPIVGIVNRHLANCETRYSRGVMAENGTIHLTKCPDVEEISALIIGKIIPWSANSRSTKIAFGKDGNISGPAILEDPVFPSETIFRWMEIV